MSNSVTAPNEQNTAELQKTEKTCETQRNRLVKVVLVYLLIFLLGTAAVFCAVRFTGTNIITHPDFDPNAMKGEPEVGEKYAYSSIDVNKGYTVKLCGLIANDGQELSFQLTNPKDNSVWLRAEVQDEKGRVLGQTGVLKQGEYLPSVRLDKPLTEWETPIVVKVIAYEPYKWTSMGNVSLNLTVYLNYR